MAADDHAAVAAMVKYPLTISPGGRDLTCRNAVAPERQLRAGLHARGQGGDRCRQARQLLVRDQGVMLGNGEIWMNEVGGSTTVNCTR